MKFNRHVEADPIDELVKQQLDSSPYAASALTRLTGGAGNFLYCATLETPLEGGVTRVAVKHGEGFAPFDQNFLIPISRCSIEQRCIGQVSQLPSPNAIRPPIMYHFYPETNTQIQEYIPNSMNLKAYALKHFASPTPVSQRPIITGLGHSLGAWLKAFHDWADRPEQAELRATVKENETMVGLKYAINYDGYGIMQTMADFPEILEGSRDIFQQVVDMAAAELKDENLGVIHGDFWTGNIILPDEPIAEETPIRVIDWEVAQLAPRALDVAQMVAEMWELSLFKDIDAGKWMVEGLAGGYGLRSADETFAWRVVVHVGVHLIRWGSSVPGWGSKEQIEVVVRTGRDVVVKAWERDRGWFRGHALECLLPG